MNISERLQTRWMLLMMLAMVVRPIIRNLFLVDATSRRMNKAMRPRQNLSPFITICFSSLMVGLIFFAPVIHASPMEFGELTLYLKHGFSSTELTADVIKRKLLVPLTEPQLAELKRLGASQELLLAIASPGNAVGAAQSEAYLREKELAKQEHFLIFGGVNTINDGKMLVTCQEPIARKAPPMPYSGKVVLTGTLPGMFKLNEAMNISLVNCEARKIGEFQIRDQTGLVETVPLMEVLRDFGKPVVISANASPGPVPAAARHEVTLAVAKWYHLSDAGSVPGGGPDVWMHLITSDQFTVRFLIAPGGPNGGPNIRVAESKFDIKKGSDSTGANLTLLCSDPQWNVYWKDSAGAFPGTGVIVIEPRNPGQG